MRRASLLILGVLMMTACEKQSFLRLSSNDLSEEYIPNFSTEKSFRSNLGDTITLKRIAQSNYFERIDADGLSFASLGQLDYVEAERSRLIVGSDTPYIRIDVDLNTRFNAQQRTNAEDRLTYSLSEQEGTVAQTLELAYTDTLNCLGANCAFQDTLKLQLNTFFEVFYNPRSSDVIAAIYINSSRGLVGFKTSDNVIYELISN